MSLWDIIELTILSSSSKNFYASHVWSLFSTKTFLCLLVSAVVTKHSFYEFKFPLDSPWAYRHPKLRTSIPNIVQFVERCCESSHGVWYDFESLQYAVEWPFATKWICFTTYVGNIWDICNQTNKALNLLSWIFNCVFINVKLMRWWCHP